MLLRQTDNLDIYSNCHDKDGNHLHTVADQVITVVNNYNNKTLTALLCYDKLWLLSSNCHTKVIADIPLNGERQLEFNDNEFIVHIIDSPLVYDIRLHKESSTVKTIMDDFYKVLSDQKENYSESNQEEGYTTKEIRQILRNVLTNPDECISKTPSDSTAKTKDPIEDTKENIAKASSMVTVPKDGNTQWETEFTFFGPNSNIITHLKVNYQMRNHTLQFGYWFDNCNEMSISIFDVPMEKIQKYLPFDKASLVAECVDNQLYCIKLVYNKGMKFYDTPIGFKDQQFKLSNGIQVWFCE